MKFDFTEEMNKLRSDQLSLLAKMQDELFKAERKLLDIKEVMSLVLSGVQNCAAGPYEKELLHAAIDGLEV